MPKEKGYQANWVIGNHDKHRTATRLGASRSDLVNILIQTLPGVAITYQGEELGKGERKWEISMGPPLSRINGT
jgi:alpha-glucosidase